MVYELEVPQGIPIRSRKADPSLPIPTSYSTTPHGTIFSTTPGGTRIIYDRNTLMNLRNSPLANTPPKFLGEFPGVCKISPGQLDPAAPIHRAPNQDKFSLSVEPPSISFTSSHEEENNLKQDSGEMFQMDIA